VVADDGVAAAANTTAALLPAKDALSVVETHWAVRLQLTALSTPS